MDQSLKNDEQISYLYDSRCSGEQFFENALQVFDFYFSYTDSLKVEERNSSTTSNQTKGLQTSTLESVQLIQQPVCLKSEEVVLCQEQLQEINLSNKLKKPFSIQIISEQTMAVQKTNPVSQKNGQNSQLSVFNILSESQQLILCSSSFSQVKNYDAEQVVAEGSRKKCWKKSRKTITKERNPPLIRKGKNQQSKTQKFIKFMTRYYFNKNFNQYFKRRLQTQLQDSTLFGSLPAQQKIQLLHSIIADLQSYKMEMHYSVKHGKFLKGFSDQEQLCIQDFFQKVVRKVYQIKLQTNIRRLRLSIPHQSNQTYHYLDKQGSDEFERVFESTLLAQPYHKIVTDCKFEEKLWRQIQG